MIDKFEYDKNKGWIIWNRIVNEIEIMRQRFDIVRVKICPNDFRHLKFYVDDQKPRILKHQSVMIGGCSVVAGNQIGMRPYSEVLIKKQLCQVSISEPIDLSQINEGIKGMEIIYSSLEDCV